MTAHLLAEGRLTETQWWVRRYFEHGGSVAAVCAVAGVCLLIVGLAYCLSRRQAAGLDRADDPQGLFRSALERLGLTADEQVFLSNVARSEGLEQPTAMLLSRTLYDRHVDAWLDLRHRTHLDDQTRARIRTARHLRGRLFPERS